MEHEHVQAQFAHQTRAFSSVLALSKILNDVIKSALQMFSRAFRAKKSRFEQIFGSRVKRDDLE